jgi:hypothetical protein
LNVDCRYTRELWMVLQAVRVTFTQTQNLELRIRASVS